MTDGDRYRGFLSPVGGKEVLRRVVDPEVGGACTSHIQPDDAISGVPDDAK